MEELIAKLQWLWNEQPETLIIVFVALFVIFAGFIGLFKNNNKKFWRN